MKPILIVDYGMANLRSVQKAFEKVGAVALISETQGWTVAALIFSNLFIQYFMYAVSHIPAIASDMQGSAAVWSQPAVLVLLVELLAIGLMLGVTFDLQGRKRDFV